MLRITPVQLAILVSAIVALVGIVLSVLRRTKIFFGYTQHYDAVRELARKLKGEISRDGPDLLISGRYERLPVFVRFSKLETAPAVAVQMKAPATFAFSLAPRSMQTSDIGRAAVRTGDRTFDSKYVLRADQPTQARMLLNRHVLRLLQKLGCSPQTFVSVMPGEIEVGEMTVPAPQTADHLWEHVQSMGEFAQELRRMPNADRVTLPAVYRERRGLLQAAIAVGVIGAVAVVMAASHPQTTHAVVPAFHASEDSGINVLDLPLIPQNSGWHVATATEFDPSAAGRLRALALEPEGHIAGDFGGQGNPRDSAYHLRNNDRGQRVVVIARGRNRFDMQFERIGFIARVRQPNLRYVTLQDGSVADNSDGDALLIVRDADDRASGLLVYFSQAHLILKAAADYPSVALD